MKNHKLKSLNDFKDEIHKCSKCGLCQAVCPVFKQTGNECTVSRGQFVMLDGVVKGRLKLNKNINKYLNLCLKCNKCSEFCPSDIDIVDILLCAKYEYFKNSVEGKIYGFFESKPVFNTFLNILSFFSGLFTRKIKSKKFDTRAVYFGGCVSKFTPGVNNYVTALLNKMHIEVVDVDFNCCGMPFLTTGNRDRFVENLKENIRKLPDGIDYIITDCSSCGWAWSQYVKYLDDDVLAEKLSGIKFKNLYELIYENDIKFVSKTRKKLTFHVPCHEFCSKEIEEIIKNIENSEYVELNEKDECCGFSAFEHPLSLRTLFPVLKRKRDNIESSPAECVLTSCVGCLLNLSLLTCATGKIVKRLISFLYKYCDFSE